MKNTKKNNDLSQPKFNDCVSWRDYYTPGINSLLNLRLLKLEVLKHFIHIFRIGSADFQPFHEIQVCNPLQIMHDQGLLGLAIFEPQRFVHAEAECLNSLLFIDLMVLKDVEQG